jgi:uncharacterized protein YqgQ
MSINTVASIRSLTYTIDLIRDEIRALVERNIISRKQPLYVLAEYIPPREWLQVEIELEQEEFLLRDRIGDLLGHETWDND